MSFRFHLILACLSVPFFGFALEEKSVFEVSSPLLNPPVAAKTNRLIYVTCWLLESTDDLGVSAGRGVLKDFTLSPSNDEPLWNPIRRLPNYSKATALTPKKSAFLEQFTDLTFKTNPFDAIKFQGMSNILSDMQFQLAVRALKEQDSLSFISGPSQMIKSGDFFSLLITRDLKLGGSAFLTGEGRIYTELYFQPEGGVPLFTDTKNRKPSATALVESESIMSYTIQKKNPGKDLIVFVKLHLMNPVDPGE